LTLWIRRDEATISDRDSFDISDIGTGGPGLPM
jgi:hypothetical protein